MNRDFKDRIKAMNTMYKLPINEQPVLLEDTASRLLKYKKTLAEEVEELDIIVEQIHNNEADIDIAVQTLRTLLDSKVYLEVEINSKVS